MKARKVLHRRTAPAAKARAASTKRPTAARSKLIRKILVPVDFSEHSRAALNYAAEFCENFGAQLVLVHIVEQVVYPGDWVFAPVPQVAFGEETTEDLAAKLCEFGGKWGKSAKCVVRLGRPWQQVVEVAQEQACDLIVCATHGHTGLKHVLLGSVAEKIVRHAHCPVLTVRSE